MGNKHKKQEVREDLKTKLLRQLEETGYPVELKVGNILLEHGWTQVEHNRYYIDEDEKKGREIDIYSYTRSSPAYNSAAKLRVRERGMGEN